MTGKSTSRSFWSGNLTLLLDKCAFLWLVRAPQRVSRPARRVVQDGTVEISVSAVSFWEMSLKQALGKLLLEGETIEGLVNAAATHGCELLPLTV
jgi:PIN domain nuclease of toxin-antitoxin system